MLSGQAPPGFCCTVRYTAPGQSARPLFCRRPVSRLTLGCMSDAAQSGSRVTDPAVSRTDVYCSNATPSTGCSGVWGSQLYIAQLNGTKP